MITVKNLNPFEKSLEKLAETIYKSDDFTDIYTINKEENNKKTKIYHTKFNELDVSLKVFSIYSLMNYRLEVKENGKPIGSILIDQGDPNENWNNEKTIIYTLANTNINYDEEVKKDLVSVYLKDIVNHMQSELNEKLNLATPLDAKKVDYLNVIEKMRKLKEEKNETSIKNKM